MLLSTQTKPVNWSDRVRLAWYFIQFRKRLANGVVTFSFWKKDGSIREAKGTTNMLLIPKEDHPAALSPESVTPFSAIPFYDLDKRAWRSFSITHFIGFVTVYELKETSHALHSRS